MERAVRAVRAIKSVRAVRAVMAVSSLALPVTSLSAAQAPPFRDVTGHAFGERITQHHEMVRYLERLVETSDRVVIRRIGRSWEGREFVVAIVTAPENHARLEAIRTAALRLHDPRGLSDAAAAELLRGQPAVLFFGGSIHGFELSGAEGVLKLLEHLTTRDDSATLAALRDAVVLIDPMLNPDGRDAFAQLNHQRLPAVPPGNRDDWSNDFTGWQGLQFRTGHYYFDTNRDWFAHTQPEARDRVAFLRTWQPQVAVDMHEMGADAEFYFDPPGDPTNPYFPAFASRWFRVFGDAYAAAFDSAGFEYMARERYNYFYPGYTSSRAYAGGAVAMLFEQGSTRGLALERADRTVRTLADALEQQYVAAWTAVQTAVRQRERLLREYLASQRGAVTPSAGATRRYLIDPAAGDPGLVRELIQLLERNGIAVRRLSAEVRLSGVRDRAGAELGQRTFPAGTWAVDAAQPAGPMARTLLEPETALPADFLRRARAYVERGENPRFYDITGWSLPLLFNLDGYSTADGRQLAVDSLSDEERRGAGEGGNLERAGYAYLLDGRNAATAAALWHLRDRGHRAGVLTVGSRFGSTRVASGTGIVRVGQNSPEVHDAVNELAGRYGIDVTAIGTGLADSGFPTLGSGDYTFNLAPSRIALLGEDGIQGYSFGWAWYTLDRQYGIPVTVLRTRSLAGMDLARYDVIVIPSAAAGPLREALGERGLERLDTWVRDGGTLVAIDDASDFARERFELAVRSWYDTDDGEDAQAFDVPGAVFAADLDTLRWLAAGYGRATLPVLVNSSRLLLPPEGPPSSRRRVIASYARDRPLRAGHAWAETLERIPGAVYAYEERVGDGRVILFAEDPNFRAYHRGVNRLFLNAVVLGPSAP